MIGQVDQLSVMTVIHCDIAYDTQARVDCTVLEATFDVVRA